MTKMPVKQALMLSINFFEINQLFSFAERVKSHYLPNTFRSSQLLFG
jgi:hypothetical protein